MQLTDNFVLREFEVANSASKYGLRNDVNRIPIYLYTNIIELATNLQILRDKLKQPIIISSGYRSDEYNKSVGGSVNSMHLQGKAADIKVKGIEPREIHFHISRLIEKGLIKQGGLGIYKTFVHYDIRGTRARW